MQPVPCWAGYMQLVQTRENMQRELRGENTQTVSNAGNTQPLQGAEKRASSEHLSVGKHTKWEKMCNWFQARKNMYSEVQRRVAEESLQSL